MRAVRRRLPCPPAVLVAALLAAGCRDEGPASIAPAAVAAKAEPIHPTLQRVLAQYEGMERPDINVLLISLDSLRKDFVSCYGHVPIHAPEEKTTPHIDRLAAEGVVMEEHYTNTSWTLPSHMTMMTGQPDTVHGVDYQDFALGFSRPTVAAVLQKIGYATAGFYSGPYCHERFGFARGFDEYASAYGHEAQQTNAARAAQQRLVDAAVGGGDMNRATELAAELARLDRQIDKLSHRDHSSEQVTDAALGAIERAEASDKPWFVFAHYFDPHYDYDPPAAIAERFDPDYDGDIDGKRFISNGKIRRARNPAPTYEEGLFPAGAPLTTKRNPDLTDRDLEHVLALYEAEIAWTDSQIGRLLDALRERDILDNTLVIVTADHGEEFFEHGGVGHRRTLLEEQLQAPLVMRLPGLLPAGARVRGLGGHEDLFPTILDVLGVPAPQGLLGRSLMPLVTGADDGADRYAFGRITFYHNPPPKNPRVGRWTLRETFTHDSIKIFRYRHWQVAGKWAPTQDEGMAAWSNDLCLQWIDLAEHPDEPADAFRSDFDDPRATAALEAFKRHHTRMQTAPRDVWRSFGGEGSWLLRNSQPHIADVRRKRTQFDHMSAPGS